MSQRLLLVKRISIKLKSSKSSTCRELLTIDYALESFVLFLKNSYLHLTTDNLATSLITKKGTNKPNLEEFVESINEKSQKNAVKFKISWISRNQNFIAEKMLKTIGYGDWQTTAII